MEVYLDNSATTKCFVQVADLMTQILCEDYGNPSSLHRKGVQAEQYIRYAKEVLARNLKVSEKEIFFTSGGTESDNLALMGGAYANCRSGRHLITTQIEHPAILQTMKHLEEEGFRVTYLPVDEKGCIRLEDLERAITGETILVSIMHTNNEVGSVQPIAEAGALIKRKNPRILFHVDAVQGYGKYRIFPKKLKIDMLSVSGHKIHGPKGTGFLYVDEKVKLKPILFGGGQQNGIRSGTENVPGIAGFGLAAKLAHTDFEKKTEKMNELRLRLKKRITDEIKDISVNTPEEGTAPHILNVSFKGAKSEVILHTLEKDGIYVSSGSACSSHRKAPSYVLTAIGLEKEYIDGSIRFSLSEFNTAEEIDFVADKLKRAVEQIRKLMKK